MKDNAKLEQEKIQEIASMSMVNYNEFSDFQAGLGEPGNKLLKESASYLSRIFPDEFNISDFGCSHGKNSMSNIKNALDGYLEINEPVAVQVYLVDLPDNDFDEVSKCLNNPEISYQTHKLFERNSKSTFSSIFKGASFNNRILPKDSLHLGFSFNCLGFLEKRFKLSRGIFPKSTMTTQEELNVLVQDAKEQLIRFLQARYYELKSKGRLVINIIKDADFIKDFDQIWCNYITSKGFHLHQFEAVNITLYCRSIDEINLALDHVKDEFTIIHNKSETIIGRNFSKEVLKTFTYNVVAKGVKDCQIFNSDVEAESFVEGFYDSIPEEKFKFNLEIQFVVLQKN